MHVSRSCGVASRISVLYRRSVIVLPSPAGLAPRLPVHNPPPVGADDVSGKGAEKTGGRWNRKGAPILYCSSTIALACLETLVRLSGRDPLPLNRYLVPEESNVLINPPHRDAKRLRARKVRRWTYDPRLGRSLRHAH